MTTSLRPLTLVRASATLKCKGFHTPTRLRITEVCKSKFDITARNARDFFPLSLIVSQWVVMINRKVKKCCDVTINIDNKRVVCSIYTKSLKIAKA